MSRRRTGKRWTFGFTFVYRIFGLWAKRIVIKQNMVIPMKHHKNCGFTEIKVAGVYLVPTQDGEEMDVRLYFCLPHFRSVG